jgi:ectoine hydroxylase-related dioxygenase (phytanoyl-CoA dioxygenase family)
MSKHGVDTARASETYGAERPFPALTPAQRYHLDVYGYVVIENTLTEDETGRLLEAMQRLKRDFLATEDPARATVRGCGLSAYRPNHMHFKHVLETDAAVFDYLTHPRLVGMAQEIVGGTVRLEESEAIINSRNPGQTGDEPISYGWHTGTRPDYGTYTENGLYHCPFVKTLTNLTELGPDDGGTAVIAGSHKVKCSQREIVACAEKDPSLIHQVVAPAGSTLLFGEALVHATGPIRGDRERTIIIGGYTPPMYRAWPGQEPSPEFIERTPGPLKPLISASDSWDWTQRFRTLDAPAQPWQGANGR